MGGSIEPWSRRMELFNCVVNVGDLLGRGAGSVGELSGHSLALIFSHSSCCSSNL